MATAQVSLQNFLSIPTVAFGFRPTKSGQPTGRAQSRKSKWVIRSKLADQSCKKSTVDVDRLVDFLYDDLRHVFDEQGIDRTAYHDQVRFQDPITKYDNITGYLLNIALLREFFKPEFTLHWVKKTGPYEITTRWTAVMKFILLPWKPELVLTGTSVMGIDPETGKFCSHVDRWDSVRNNDYFSLEGLWDVFKQFRFYETPELESPKYQILKRTANYEVRKYAPFTLVETTGDKLSGFGGFNTVSGLVAGYLFGKNSTKEKIPKVSIQIVLPSEKDMSSLPDPEQDTMRLRKIEGGIAAVLKFGGNPTEEVVQQKVKELQYNLKKDGLKPIINGSYLLAQYNDPRRTWSFVMRNEVLIWLEEFLLR